MGLIEDSHQFTLSPQALPFLKASWYPKIVIEPAPDPDLVGPCWLWQGARTPDGYGVVAIGGRKPRGKLWYIHRWSSHNHHGAIPPEFDVDHQCRRRGCFQPFHLRQKPMLENRVPGFLGPELSAADIAALADGHWLSVRPLGM